MSDRPTREAPIPDSRLNGDLPVTSSKAAAEQVPSEATLLVSGFGGVGYPKRVPEAIAAGNPRELTVISGGGVGTEIDESLVESGDMQRRYPFQTQPTIRDAINAGDIAFHDRHISRLADEVQFDGLCHGMIGKCVAVVEAVAVGEGWLIPSTSIGHTPTYVEVADTLIIEVNGAQPVELATLHDVHRRAAPPNRKAIPLSDPVGRINGPAIRFDPDKLVAVVETDRPDDPYEFREPGDVEHAIATNLKEFLADEIERNSLFADAVNLQFGVGSLGNALMGAIGELELGDRDLVYFGEVIQDGLLDMLENGTLRGASATSLALSAEGQERFFETIDLFTNQITLRPADVSNAAALIDRFGVLGINSAVEVDLVGNANATHIDGTKVVSGIGGGGDFARNSRLGVVALPSTAADGDISRIVPAVSHVDHTEHDASIIVTEHGVADLRGLSPRERGETLVEIAAPQYREDLQKYLGRTSDAGGHTPFHPESAFDWRSDSRD